MLYVQNASFLARQLGYKYYWESISYNNKKIQEVLKDRHIRFFERNGIVRDYAREEMSSDIFKI